MKFEVRKLGVEYSATVTINISGINYIAMSELKFSEKESIESAKNNLLQVICIKHSKNYDNLLVLVDLDEIDIESLEPIFYLKNINVKCFKKKGLKKDLNADVFTVNSLNNDASSIYMAMYIASFVSSKSLNYINSLSLCIISRNKYRSQTILDCIDSIEAFSFIDHFLYSSPTEFLENN